MDHLKKIYKLTFELHVQ